MKERERKRESKKCPFLFYPVSVNLYKVYMNAEKIKSMHFNDAIFDHVQ